MNIDTYYCTRTATLSDLDSLNELLSQLFQQEDEFKADIATQTRGLTEILQNPDIGCILVSCETDSQQIVGMVNLLFTISTAFGGKVAWLEDMVVSANFQQRGIGNTLLQTAFATAKQQGCKRITLLTDQNNLSAQTFYAKNGFQASGMKPFRLHLG